MDRKLFAGPRLRRLRRERGFTQARMAEELAISTSYLNLLERNQRPVTAQILLNLAEAFDVDIKSFAGDGEAQTLAGLKEVMGDPLFEGQRIGLQELKDLANASPEIGQAMVTLYQAYRESAARAIGFAEQLAGRDHATEAPGLRFPVEDVRDFLHARHNHFPELETAAEDLGERLGVSRIDLFAGLRRHLGEGGAGIGVNVVPVDVMPHSLRFFDRHRRRILLSEMLTEPGRVFQLGVQIALIDHHPLIERIVAEAGITRPESRRLCALTLANYFAAAVMMPYQSFLSAAESTRYDIDILCARFGTSFEQASHRLTTLQRAGARGVPFFLMRIDNAGNISKRFSAGGFAFARLGGACPRWNVHRAFQIPGRIYTQIIQMPEGETYFSIARTVDPAGGGFAMPERLLAIGLGCELSHAGRLVYSDGRDIDNAPTPTPIGINCRLCERIECTQRAFPPLNRPLVVQEHRRDLSPIAFATD
jgi:XRE family transcriptional regulator, fatty acid utilization regulator